LPPGTQGWTPLGVKILSFHFRENSVLLRKANDDMMTTILNKVTSTGADVGRPPVNRKKPSAKNNRFRSVTVYDTYGNRFSEDVITCPRVIDDNEIAVYFVSKEYNVNFASDSLTNPIAARFLFSQDQRSGRMILLAIAEEPARPLIDPNSEPDIEDLYIKRRQGKEPGKCLSCVKRE